MLAELCTRHRLRFNHDSAQKKMARMQRKVWRATLALSIGSLIVSLGFIIPAGQLALWAATRLQENFNGNFLSLLFNSFALASLASLCCLIIAIFLAYTKRVFNSRLELGAVGVASLGYAVPGTVIAVGVLIPIAWLDNQIDFRSEAWFTYPTGLLLSGTIGILVFAYVIRFLSVALNTVDSGLTAIKPSIDESARSLGAPPGRCLSRVHLPILRTSLLTALLLVCVEVLKELPTTLILRPFNFNTLAVRTFELASDERLVDAALPALAIVIIGLLPVLLITKSILNERSTDE